MLKFVWLWSALLLPLPLLVRYLFPARSQQNDAALRIPFMQDFQNIENKAHRYDSNKFILLLASLAWLFLVLAAMRPQWLGDAVELPVSGRDLMMAVDLSGSMQVEDFEINGRTVNRLQATKHVASEFIQSRQGDRIGLILFGRQAYLQTPLTFDRSTVNTLLNESAIGLAGKETAIGDAIGLAIKRLVNFEQANKDKQQSKVLILLTDGANTAGDITPLKAAELAAENKLKIYTIGIGADEMIRNTFFGAQRVNPSADLDEKTLRGIADATGGKYFRARDTKELKNIYALLNELEPTEKESQHFRPVSALYYWPLSISFILATLIAVIKLYPVLVNQFSSLLRNTASEK